LTQESNKYDYIIAGGGLAGLSLAYKLRLDKTFDKKRILILDKSQKEINDRTWCFWSKSETDFESIVHHQWPKIEFHSNRFSKNYKIKPYVYKMIKGLDFYNYCRNQLSKYSNTEIRNEAIIDISDDKEKAIVKTKNNTYISNLCFKSYYDKKDFTKDHFVWQHFKGFTIDTQSNHFDDTTATFMDFRVDQNGETRFFYVLPTSPTTALIEFTIFSSEISESKFYDPYLYNYIDNVLKIKDYKIVEEEVGAIPMTTHKFQATNSKRIIPIGTNGGAVKASSGYAFSYIQKNTQSWNPQQNRYKFYDQIFLNAILTGKTQGNTVFENLFEKLSPQTIFKFLDEEGTIGTDLKVFTAPPTLPFFRAFLQELF